MALRPRKGALQGGSERGWPSGGPSRNAYPWASGEVCERATRKSGLPGATQPHVWALDYGVSEARNHRKKGDHKDDGINR